jgi:hypothetical protein
MQVKIKDFLLFYDEVSDLAQSYPMLLLNIDKVVPLILRALQPPNDTQIRPIILDILPSLFRDC